MSSEGKKVNTGLNNCSHSWNELDRKDEGDEITIICECELCKVKRASIYRLADEFIIKKE
ncbi:MAG TPA: hypothetical protein PKL77_08930 [Candidatus Omnitrophota bacterium]|nr:hypothetical protein [Candidatus Omnitrophota bacterium]